MYAVLTQMIAIHQNVTGPAKIDHVSTKRSPIFSVFAIS